MFLVKMMLPLSLWLLLLLCSSSTGVPLTTTGATSTSGNVTVSPAHGLQSVTNQTTEEPGASHNTSAETLTELQSDVPTLEGDILLTEDRNAVNRLWSNAVVPYTISPELAYRQAEIEEAFRMIMSSTCIRFQEHTDEMNYIEIKNGEGCASHIGCRGGSQPLYFGGSCSVGNLAHEMIHGLGLYHEHTRIDRDQYITINWEKVVPDKTVNFEIKQGNTLNLPYDYQSIMHYGTSFFSVDGTPTIMTNGGVSIGQRTRLSPLDIQKLNALYHCY